MVETVVSEQGLRQRKKVRTRREIYEAAHRLFARQSFDAVTVAAVARAAEVSEPTVFNYFPTKEDLFFGGMESFESQLVTAVKQRPPGESATTAFMRELLESSKTLEEDQRVDVIAAASRMIAASPALQVREREIVAHHTRELARSLGHETRGDPDDIEAFAVANALMGAHRGLVEHVRNRVEAGSTGTRLAAEFRRLARRAFGRLETGLAGYAIKAR